MNSECNQSDASIWGGNFQKSYPKKENARRRENNFEVFRRSNSPTSFNFWTVSLDKNDPHDLEKLWHQSNSRFDLVFTIKSSREATILAAKLTDFEKKIKYPGQNVDYLDNPGSKLKSA